MAVAQLYTTLDVSLISEQSVLDIVNAITQDMTTNGYQTLEELGTSAWNGGNVAQAIAYYEKSLEVKPDNPGAMYLLGRAYQQSGNAEQANLWFGKLLQEYPDSRQAGQARSAMGES